MWRFLYSTSCQEAHWQRNRTAKQNGKHSQCWWRSMSNEHGICCRGEEEEKVKIFEEKYVGNWVVRVDIVSVTEYCHLGWSGQRAGWGEHSLLYWCFFIDFIIFWETIYFNVKINFSGQFTKFLKVNFLFFFACFSFFLEVSILILYLLEADINFCVRKLIPLAPQYIMILFCISSVSDKTKPLFFSKMEFRYLGNNFKWLLIFPNSKYQV